MWADLLVNKINPLLRLAAISGVETAIKHHIRKGDDLNARDADGATPLILAASRKKRGAVQLLLDAGADPTIQDEKGLDALAHAKVVGCSELVTVLTETLTSRVQAEVSTPEKTCFEHQNQNFENISVDVVEITQYSPNPITFAACERENDSLSKSHEPTFDDADLLDEWEPESESTSPNNNVFVTEEIKKLQESIGRYKPLSSDEEWGDIDLHLPEQASSLEIDANEESVRSLLLTSLRDGIISEYSLSEICSEKNGTRDHGAEGILAFVATELGGNIVEWSHSEDPFWGEPTTEDDHEIDKAIVFLRELSSGWNTPFRFYSKELRGDPLDAKEEISLAQEMEKSTYIAMEALAQWPSGLNILFEAADKVTRGESKEREFFKVSDQSIDENQSTFIEIPDSDEEEINSEELDYQSNFLSAISELRAAQGNVQSTADALKQIQLSSQFIKKLACLASNDPAGKLFLNAIERYSNARERMIRCNLRLALSIAKKFMWSDLPLDDLVQEANIGLMKAVERYDWSKGFRFSTYATWWIRQQVSRAIADTARAVRAPVHIQEAAKRIIRERNEIGLKLGRFETHFETAKRIGMTLTKTGLVLSLFDDIESLDRLDPETGQAPVDLLEDVNDIDPAVLVEKMVLRSTLLGMLNELSEKQRDVLILRFGLNGQDGETLEEVGQRFNLTRERIRQIESKALGKLSLPSKMETLTLFL